MIRLFSTLTAVLVFVCSAPLYASQDQPAALQGIRIEHEEEFGGVCIMIPTDSFHEDGYDYGDSVTVTFSNGYSLEDLPYFSGYYVLPGESLLRGVRGADYVKACINYGDDLWVKAGLSEDDTADICLLEKEKYVATEEACSLKYGNDREDYASDAIFANFRSVTTGNLAEGMLYRSASPCNNKYQRAPYVDGLAQDAGVEFILDLADNDEKITGYLSEEDYNSLYFLSLYKDGKVEPVSLDMNYTSDDFRGKLVSGLKVLAGTDGPFLVHCTEGKDRTGFVCMLLEALTGSTYDEMIDDYMMTYWNYYGVSRESDAEKYNSIKDLNIVPMLSFLTGEDEAEASSADYTKCAEDYLIEGGMTKEEVAALRSRLTGSA